MSKGFVKLHRKLSSWKYKTKSHAFCIWIELILSATHKPYKSGTWTLKKGQVKTSAVQLSKQTGVSRPTVNKWLKTFEKEKMINRYQLPNNQGTIITILKYDQYQKDPKGGCDVVDKGPVSKLAAHNNVTIGDDFSDKKSRPKTREIDW